MLNRRHLRVATLGLVAVGAAMLSVTRSVAGAEVLGTAGLPIVAPDTDTMTSIQFLGSEAGHTGQMYFLGTGPDALTVNSFAANTDDSGLGTFLFNNHESTIGEVVILPDAIRGGSFLHFAYDVIAPSHASNERYRTDQESDRLQFMFDPESGFLGVEDLRLPFSDEDYNDAMFRVSYSAIPGPGGLIAMSIVVGIGGLCRAGRR